MAAEDTEDRSERLSVAVTPTEKRALEFISRVTGTKYDGASTVVRDFSLRDAVTFHRRALAEAGGAQVA